MKLRSPALERNVRKLARREMRRDKATWKDYKRHKTGWRARVAARDRVVIVFLGVLGLVIAAVVNGRVQVVLIGAALYSTATAIWRAFRFRSDVLGGYDRAVLVHLPVEDGVYVRHEFRRFTWSWAGAFLLFILAYGALAVATYGISFYAAGVVLFSAAVQTLVAACASMLVLIWVPKTASAGRFYTASAVFYLAIIVCAYLPQRAVDLLWSAVLITPGGWISHSFAALAMPGSAGGLYWLLPGLTFCAALPFTVVAARRGLSAEVEAQTADALADVVSGQFEEEEEDDQADLFPAIDSGPQPNSQFLQPADWSRAGWVERIVGTALNSRQRTVAEFMLAGQLGAWSKRWRGAAWISAAGTILAIALPSLPGWAPFLPLGVAGALGTPVFGGVWPGFSRSFASERLVPLYAGFPIGYREISAVMLKANVVRIVVWAPFAVVYAMALARQLGEALASGALVGAEVGIVLLALQPAMVVAHFSQGTNDSQQTSWQTFVAFALSLVLFACFAAAVIVLFAADAIFWKLLMTLAVLGASGIAWLGYGLLLNRGSVDLLSRVQ